MLGKVEITSIRIRKRNVHIYRKINVGLVIERSRVRVPAGAAGECSFPKFTFRADSCSVSVPTRVIAAARKGSQSFCQSAGGRLQINTHTPFIQRSRSGLTMLSKHIVGTYQGNEITRNQYGNTRPQSSHLAESLWTDPDVKKGTGEGH